MTVLFGSSLLQKFFNSNKMQALKQISTKSALQVHEKLTIVDLGFQVPHTNLHLNIPFIKVQCLSHSLLLEYPVLSWQHL